MKNLKEVKLTGGEGWGDILEIYANGRVYKDMRTLQNALRCLMPDNDEPGYNKMSFIATFEDGEEYEGRFELCHGIDDPTTCNNLLEQHCHKFLDWYSIPENNFKAHAEKDAQKFKAYKEKYSFNFPKKLRGLSVYVYRTEAIGDCTLGGITSLVDMITIVGEGIEGNVTVKEGEPYLVVDSIFKGKKHYFAKPVNHGDQNRSFMMGGNYVATSDSRFSYKMLPVHDRQE